MKENSHKSDGKMYLEDMYAGETEATPTKSTKETKPDAQAKKREKRPPVLVSSDIPAEDDGWNVVETSKNKSKHKYKQSQSLSAPKVRLTKNAAAKVEDSDDDGEQEANAYLKLAVRTTIKRSNLRTK